MAAIDASEPEQAHDTRARNAASLECASAPSAARTSFKQLFWKTARQPSLSGDTVGQNAGSDPKAYSEKKDVEAPKLNADDDDASEQDGQPEAKHYYPDGGAEAWRVLFVRTPARSVT